MENYSVTDKKQNIDTAEYTDCDKNYKDIVLDEIEKEKKRHG